MNEKIKAFGITAACLFSLIANSSGKAQNSQNLERENQRGRLEKSVENSKTDVLSSGTLQNSISAKIKAEKAKLKAETEKIIANYETHGEYASAAKLAEKIGDNERASLDYEMAGRIDEAIKLAKDKERISKILIKSGRASEAVEKAQTLEDRAKIYSETGKLGEAGRIYEELGDKASKENNSDLAKVHYTKATEIYQKMGWTDSRAQIFIKLGDYQAAMETYSSAGCRFSALEVLDKWEKHINGLSEDEKTTQTVKSKSR